MTKANTKSRATIEIATITLKSIIRDIYANNANATITDKQIRAKLRVIYRDDHVHNTSWVFTQSRAHDVRMMFDNAYRAKHERIAKRATSSRATPRKRIAKSNDVATNDDATNASE